MAKPKINVLSNKLDQAPKTKAAWYDKVVDSMKKEMTEAMNSTNVPKILSNELDQAPKTKAAWYKENVLKPIQSEIHERMDTIFMHWSDLICDFVNNFVGRPENEFIRDRILILKPGDSLSFEIKREKIKPSGEGFQKTVWHPAFLWGFDNFLHNFYRKSKSWQIMPWEISSAIIIKKNADDPKLLEIHAEQLEYPGKWSLLMKWLFFHNSNVSDEDFLEITKSISD